MTNRMDTRTRGLARRLLDVVLVWLAIAAGLLVVVLLWRAGQPPQQPHTVFMP